jgi:hypothetical protein
MAAEWRSAGKAVAIRAAGRKPGGRRGAWEEEIVGAFAYSGGLLILAFTVLPVLYMLPTLIGAIRRVDGLALVCLVNLIGAPTGVGWIGAMIMAFGPKRHLSPAHTVRRGGA